MFVGNLGVLIPLMVLKDSSVDHPPTMSVILFMGVGMPVHMSLSRGMGMHGLTSLSDRWVCSEQVVISGNGYIQGVGIPEGTGIPKEVGNQRGWVYLSPNMGKHV